MLDTVENVRTFLEELNEIYAPSDQITDNDLIWFNCCWSANMMLDSFSTSDMASFLKKGQSPLDKLEDLQDSLTDEFAQNTDDPMIADLFIQYELVKHFFGHDVAAPYLERLEEHD